MIGYFLVNAPSIGSSDQTIFQNLVWMFSPFLSICLMLAPPSGRVSIAREAPRRVETAPHGFICILLRLFDQVVSTAKVIECEYKCCRTGWCGSTVMELYSVGAPFESVLRYELF
jgi:hypothetical protein